MITRKKNSNYCFQNFEISQIFTREKIDSLPESEISTSSIVSGN